VIEGPCLVRSRHHHRSPSSRIPELGLQGKATLGRRQRLQGSAETRWRASRQTPEARPRHRWATNSRRRCRTYSRGVAGRGCVKREGRDRRCRKTGREGARARMKEVIARLTFQFIIFWCRHRPYFSLLRHRLLFFFYFIVIIFAHMSSGSSSSASASA